MNRGKIGKGLIGGALLTIGLLMLRWFLYSSYGGDIVDDWMTKLYALVMLGFGVGGCLVITSAFRHPKSN